MQKESSLVMASLLTTRLATQPVTRVIPPTFVVALPQTTVMSRPDVVAARVADPINQPKIAPVATVPLARPVLTQSIAFARFNDPSFAVNIINNRTPTDGVRRDQIKAPIAPADNVTDEMIFEDAADPSKKFYIPRYKVMTEMVGGQQRYQVALQKSGEEWTLTIRLQRFRVPAIASVAPEATEMPHRLAIILKHNQLSGGHVIAQEELEFKEKTVEADGIRAVLRGNTLPELDLIYQTLTDPVYGAALIVRNWVTVGVPVPAAQQHPTPQDPRSRVAPPLAHIQIAAPPSRANAVVRDHRAKVTAPLRPDAVIRDRRIPRTKPPRGVEVSPPPQPPLSTQPLFRQVDRVIDDNILPNPFVFPPTIHDYIFGGISAKPGGQFNLVRHQVSWKGRMHSYYQNPIRSYQFYYLPDSFKVARRPNPPYEPVVSVRFAATEAALEKVQVAMDYIALPFVNADRLEAAVGTLRTKVSGPVPADVNAVAYEPLLNPADKTHLRVAIPRADASSGFDERKDALVDLRSGIHDSLSLMMPQFQAVYEAMFGSANILLSGTVAMDVGGDQESIPFAARMNDLVGQVFEYTEEWSQEEGLKATFRNAIESPVQINNLSTILSRNLERFPATIQGLDFTQPIRVEPNAQISFKVAPTSPITGDGPVTANYDLDGVEVIPDKEAIWNLVLDPSTPGVFIRPIKVKTHKQRFDPPPNQPETQILSLVVDFEDGNSVELNAEHLEQEVGLRVPIGDFVLRKTDARQYRYKVRVIRLSGTTADPDWKTDDTGILFPTVS
jgi:hypothetical protein